MEKNNSFWQSLWQASTRLKVSLVSLGLLLLLLPGQNDYQLLWPNPQAAPVKRTPVELGKLSPYPVSNGVSAPYTSARAVLVMDAESAAVLYQKNPNTQLLPASTTKIMTALVALEAYPLDQLITVKQASSSIGHSMRLIPGETISVEALLYGILVESGNDAAFALAQHYPGGYQAFINRMNQKAQELSLTGTQFRNVSGVEQAGHVTSVRDLSLLAKQALKNPIFTQMVGTKTIVVKNYDGTISHRLQNINELLGVVPGLTGIKTGWTENAGECLVTATERASHQIITVVLGSQDRFGETQALIEWAYANHTWQQLGV